MYIPNHLACIPASMSGASGSGREARGPGAEAASAHPMPKTAHRHAPFGALDTGVRPARSYRSCQTVS
jgi:hypothetical protein